MSIYNLRSIKSIPRHKICRHLGVSVCGAVNCPLARRPNPPGQHGNARRQKNSEYALQLMETQKLRAYYGISAKQLIRYYREAAQSRTQTNIALVQKLETRLDNVVYRLGFTCSLRASRQMVVHRHILVNDRIVNKPGFRVKPGDVIQLKEKSQKVERYKDWFNFYNPSLAYVQKNSSNFSGTLLSIPEREQVPIILEDQLVVEFMAR